MAGLDPVDEQLVDALRRDARVSTAELGRRVGLSRTATLARIRSLEDRGVIRGYHADVHVDGDAAPGYEATVGIVVRTPDVASYVRRLATIPELVQAESVAGDLDLLVRFATPSAARLDAILDRINGWPETRRTTTYVVLTRYVTGS